MTSETFLPRTGGAEIHAQNLIDNLIELGHTVTLLTNEGEQSDFDAKIAVIRVPWKKSNAHKIFRQLWVHAKDADVIHSHYCYRLALFAAIVGKLRGVPVIITLHGLGILNHPGTAFVYQLAHSCYRYFSLRLSTHVISTSQDLAGVAYKYIPRKKVTVISNGYNDRVFHPRVSVSPALREKYRGKKVILTVRRLVPKNGIHFLVEAMPYIIEKIPDVKYIMIGDGRMRDHLHGRINALKVGECVEMAGMVENAKIPEYLQLADVVVFPSTAESTSIACAEAMGLGKRIVASRVGGLVELLGENEDRGWLVRLVDWQGSNYDAPLTLDAGRYQDLADTIYRALKSDGTRERNAEAFAKKHLSWRSIAQSTVEVYNRFQIQ